MHRYIIQVDFCLLSIHNCVGGAGLNEFQVWFSIIKLVCPVVDQNASYHSIVCLVSVNRLADKLLQVLQTICSIGCVCF